MKTGAPDDPKMLDFSDWIDRETNGVLAAAGVDPRAVACGMMERLWHWTARYAATGAVGRYSDARIADAVGWRGDPARLVEALVGIGYLDACDDHRLIVHRWSVHCEDAVHARLARAGERFADGSVPRMSKLSRGERAAAAAKYSVSDDSAGDDDEAEQPGYGTQQPQAADGRRRQPARAMPCHVPTPNGVGLGARARDPSPARPLDRKRLRDVMPDALRDTAEPIDWQHACDVADAIEGAKVDGRVVGEGGEHRAIAAVWAWVDMGAEAQTWVRIKRVVGDLIANASDATCRKIVNDLRNYPDGLIPGRGDSPAESRGAANSRIEQGERRLKRLGVSPPPRNGHFSRPAPRLPASIGTVSE